MSGGIALVEPSLGATFAIPKNDWIATNNFCWGVGVYEEINPDNPTGPGIPAPVSQECHDACAGWIEGNYVDFVNQAGALAPVCQATAASLAGLKQMVDQLAPGSALTPAQQSSASSVLASFADTAGEQAAIFQAQSATILSLAELIGEFQQPVLAWMPDWFTDGPPDPAALAQTTGLLQGAWTAVTDDLTALSLPPDQITTAYLLSLELEEGVLGWTSLGVEAQSFSAAAPPLGAQ